MNLEEGIYENIGFQQPQQFKKGSLSLKRVLKIYEGQAQFIFFQKESDTLNKLNQTGGKQFPGIIKIHDSQVL